MMDKFTKLHLTDHQFKVFLPTQKGDIKSQVINCINQLNSYLDSAKYNKRYVVRQNYFVSVNINSEFEEAQKIILSLSNDFFGLSIPLSVISQPPLADDIIVVAEYLILPGLENDDIEYKKIDDTPYIVAQNDIGSYIIAAGIGKIISISDIYNQATYSFEIMEQILKNENLNFSDIIRQWNYIENIVGYTSNMQHYQIFNDVRSTYYEKSDFVNGYPAATGIGMNCGGVIIDFIAFKPANSTRIIPIHSPVQVNAHQYSINVLDKYACTVGSNPTTPKFERAKVVINDSMGILFVSGTAAIKGELSYNQNNIEVQTQMTVDNVQKLVEFDNLKKHNILDCYEIIPHEYRVYIKRKEDYFVAKNIIDKTIGNVPVLYLMADICRQELLIEIEAVYTLMLKE